MSNKLSNELLTVLDYLKLTENYARHVTDVLWVGHE